MSRTEAATGNGGEASGAKLALKREQQLLQHWLLADAYPLWATQGYDRIHGGFEESLNSAGPTPNQPRRARVQARQIYCFARAASLGWRPADAARLVTDGLAYFLAHYRRPDGLFRTLVAADGAALDDRAVLYDQAFVLLALAESQSVLGPQPELLQTARVLRAAIYQQLKRSGPGFSSGVPDALPLLANPHMHLLEAALSWIAVGDDPAWSALADEIVALALSRFIDPGSGAVREQFDADWAPLAGIAGRVVEPGHQFEWGWLLLRWGAAGDGAANQAAARLVQLGEAHGIRDGVAINELLDDFSVRDGEARLWPQTERLKAAVRMAAVTHDPRYWSMAVRAAQGLRRYFDTALRGLWYDRLTLDGQFVQQPAPASSFYHIVCAIAELKSVLEQS
ncbi:MAG TPA: AGE family epimerase/isomerase [Steroidobacteraceae bacterium]|jgi:mannose-6-phosphate isomerase|nr:AGE family epimerase/isomerase [Steroidobacteraceae bacterium]